MSENEEKALMYYFLKMKQSVDTGQFKGLKLKSCCDFIRLINDLSTKLDNIVDLEEVLSYGK